MINCQLRFAGSTFNEDRHNITGVFSCENLKCPDFLISERHRESCGGERASCRALLVLNPVPLSDFEGFVEINLDFNNLIAVDAETLSNEIAVTFNLVTLEQHR